MLRAATRCLGRTFDGAVFLHKKNQKWATKHVNAAEVERIGVVSTKRFGPKAKEACLWI